MKKTSYLLGGMEFTFYRPFYCLSVDQTRLTINFGILYRMWGKGDGGEDYLLLSGEGR